MLSVGVDIIEIERIGRALARWDGRFLRRVYTEAEVALCRGQVPELAVRFAGKEAISKALGTGFGEHLSWHDIEIFNDALGRPEVHLSTKIQNQFKNPKILVSISHSTDYASAVALWSS